MAWLCLGGAWVCSKRVKIGPQSLWRGATGGCNPRTALSNATLRQQSADGRRYELPSVFSTARGIDVTDCVSKLRPYASLYFLATYAIGHLFAICRILEYSDIPTLHYPGMWTWMVVDDGRIR